MLGTSTPPADGDLTWDKAAWRAWARARRRALRAEAGPSADAAITSHLLAWQPFASAGVVGVYLAFGSEVDLAALSAAARRDGKLVVAPRVVELPAPLLTLHELEPGARLVRHALGQPEPPADAVRVDPARVDVLLVPGLAFDELGHRLGYGRGYYDRLLPLLRPDARVVGVTLDGLVVPALPAEPHDAKVAHLVTEHGIRDTLT